MPVVGLLTVDGLGLVAPSQNSRFASEPRTFRSITPTCFRAEVRPAAVVFFRWRASHGLVRPRWRRRPRRRIPRPETWDLPGSRLQQ